MARSIGSPGQKALVAFIKRKRKEADLTQAQVARRLRRYQSFVATIEAGQKRIDVVELVELAEAIGFDPREALKVIMRAKQRERG